MNQPAFPEWATDRRRLTPPLELEDLRLPPAEVGSEMLLPLPHSPPGYVYFTDASVTFELWMGGDHDVTVRLFGPAEVTGPGAEKKVHAGRSRRSDLAALLRLTMFDVDRGRALGDGRLIVEFEEGSRLVALPQGDPGWEVTWPDDLNPAWWVASGEGDLQVQAGRPLPREMKDEEADRPGRSLPGPGRTATGWSLPVNGAITQVAVSSTTIELMVNPDEDSLYCIHIAGSFELRSAGEAHTVVAGTEAREEVWPVLDLIGHRLVAARSEGGRLHLHLGDVGDLATHNESWEAHGPVSTDSYEEWWFPEEGPRFP